MGELIINQDISIDDLYDKILDENPIILRVYAGIITGKNLLIKGSWNTSVRHIHIYCKIGLLFLGLFADTVLTVTIERYIDIELFRSHDVFPKLWKFESCAYYAFGTLSVLREGPFYKPFEECFPSLCQIVPDASFKLPRLDDEGIPVRGGENAKECYHIMQNKAKQDAAFATCVVIKRIFQNKYLAKKIADMVWGFSRKEWKPVLQQNEICPETYEKIMVVYEPYRCVMDRKKEILSKAQHHVTELLLLNNELDGISAEVEQEKSIYEEKIKEFKGL